MKIPTNPSPPLAHVQGTVLVVDDIDYMRKQMSLILRQAGIANVVEASDGGKAFGFLTSAPEVFSLIVSDHEMDPLSGLHLLRLIRKEEITPEPLRNLPFILVSSDATHATLAEGKALGMDGFIAKPFTGTTLIKTVLKVLISRQNKTA